MAQWPSRDVLVTGLSRLPCPGKQFVDAIDRMTLADAVEDVRQPDLRVHFIELGGLEQRIHRRGPLAAAVRTGEQPVLAPDRDAAQRVLGKVVVDLEAAIVGVGEKLRLELDRIAQRLGQR